MKNSILKLYLRNIGTNRGWIHNPLKFLPSLSNSKVITKNISFLEIKCNYNYWIKRYKSEYNNTNKIQPLKAIYTIKTVAH